MAISGFPHTTTSPLYHRFSKDEGAVKLRNLANPTHTAAEDFELLPIGHIIMKIHSIILVHKTS